MILIIKAVGPTFLCGVTTEHAVKDRVLACKEKVPVLPWWVTHFITPI